ncbi:MAG TPA: DNA-directed RNA polymerase subunit omega [Thermoanaerobaculia bacterium]|nr:DNA-directed RNA polymerase subunit omega [Thermoanaerobaculia bacterium]
MTTPNEETGASPMTETPEETPESPEIESKFRLVHIASRRAEQLMLGARPKVETKHTKYSRVALDEVAGGHVKWQLGQRPAEGLVEGEPDPGAIEPIDPLPLITP